MQPLLQPWVCSNSWDVVGFAVLLEVTGTFSISSDAYDRVRLVAALVSLIQDTETAHALAHGDDSLTSITSLQLLCCVVPHF